jgi:glyoxylase-like metal-dependent hydrolase (beta-lactamase superfamily II)
MADTAQVLLHGNDRDWLLSRRAHMHPDGYQSIPFRYLDDPEALARQDALVMENLSGELAADRELVGGEHIHLGGDIRLEAVHTPGHSPGSVSFVLDGLDWVFTGDGVQGNGSQSGQFPLFIDPVAYRASQQRLLDDVRPKRLYMGHRFRDAAGNLHDAQLERPAVADMLRDSLAVQERIAEAVKLVTPAAVEQPNALALGPAAEALGYAPDQPLTWPNALFTTLHGYLPRAAAPTTTGM